MIRKSLYVDPQTGGYTNINGNLNQVNATINKINTLLSMSVGSNIYAINEGNPLIGRTELVSLSEAANAISKCLQPLISNGEISVLTVQSFSISPTFRYKIALLIELPNGQTEIINWKS